VRNIFKYTHTFVDSNFCPELMQATPMPDDSFSKQNKLASSPCTLPLAAFASPAALLKRMWGLEKPRSFSRATSLLLTGLI